MEIPFSRLFRAAVLLFTLALPASLAAQPIDTPSLTLTERWPRVTMANPHARAAVFASLDGAVEWLSTTKCQAVLTEFRDQQGCPLADKLAALGTTFDTYLQWMVIRDVSDTTRCRKTQFIFTMPGSRVVFVCGTTFFEAWRNQRKRATALLIHEALHTLGLGENGPFPTSEDITSRVLKLCGPEW